MAHDATRREFLAASAAVGLGLAAGGRLGAEEPKFKTTLKKAKIVAKPTESGKHVATIAGTTMVFELPAGAVTQLQKPLGFFKGQ